MKVNLTESKAMRNGEAPKRNFVPVNLWKKMEGKSVRRGYGNQIMYNETDLPKPVTYEDIDSTMADYIKEKINLSDPDGKKVPLFSLYSNQRFSEYSQTWEHTDKDGNLLMNFMTINRENNPKNGTNQGSYWNIPGNRFYPLLKRTVLEEDGTETLEIYSMRQPYAIDMTYHVNFVTNTFAMINKFNQTVISMFKARQDYIRVNGHYFPLILETINDETSYTIEDRRFFVQSIDLNLMTYINDKEDFKVDRFPKNASLHMQGDKRKRKVSVGIEDFEDKKIDITMDFEPYVFKIEFDMDTDVKIENYDMQNIRNFRLFSNDTPVYYEKGFKLKDGDNVKIKIKPIDESRSSKIILHGIDEKTRYKTDEVDESVTKDSEKSEEIIIE